MRTLLLVLPSDLSPRTRRQGTPVLVPDPTGTALETVQSGLITVTEPVLAPVRRVIPRAGGFDLSFLVVFFGIVIFAC